VGILSIRSESLLQIELKDLDDVQQLIIVAPALKVLKESCGMAFDCQNLSPSAHLASVGVLFWSKIGSV
jgi:hypothetical protein